MGSVPLSEVLVNFPPLGGFNSSHVLWLLCKDSISSHIAWVHPKASGPVVASRNVEDLTYSTFSGLEKAKHPGMNEIKMTKVLELLWRWTSSPKNETTLLQLCPRTPKSAALEAIFVFLSLFWVWESVLSLVASAHLSYVVFVYGPLISSTSEGPAGAFFFVSASELSLFLLFL